MTNWSMEVEGKRKVELTANPKADALCLMNDTAVEREKEKERKVMSVISLHLLHLHHNYMMKHYRIMRCFTWISLLLSNEHNKMKIHCDGQNDNMKYL